MIKDKNFNHNASCDKYLQITEYTHLQEIIDNLPYIFMLILGAAIHIIALKSLFLGIIAAVLYIILGIVGALWIILFVCPYCGFFDTRLCPCGYGQISVKLARKGKETNFNAKFKRNIPMIVPVWIIPMVVAIVALAMDWNSLLLTVTVAFFINSFIILPLAAKIYGCGHCPQKNECPWMMKK
jgi:hypothetical protein